MKGFCLYLCCAQPHLGITAFSKARTGQPALSTCLRWCAVRSCLLSASGMPESLAVSAFLLQPVSEACAACSETRRNTATQHSISITSLQRYALYCQNIRHVNLHGVIFGRGRCSVFLLALAASAVFAECLVLSACWGPGAGSPQVVLCHVMLVCGLDVTSC